VTTKRQVLAVLLAVSYFGLVALSTVCLFGVSPVGAGTHHHHAGSAGKAAHSPLCAWACQAGPSASLIGFGEALSIFFVLWVVVLAALANFPQIAWASARPRSPPVLSR
jgi:hypothetical protein